MGKLTFILGGARSGKSAYAQRLAEKHGGRVAFLATATADDAEMQTRIDYHRAERPAHWQTREIPFSLAAALSIAPLETDVVLLDCVTLLVSNVLFLDGSDEPDESAAMLRVDVEINALLTLIEQDSADWLIVSNEVGLGLVPVTPLGRIYRDLLGRANRVFAARADKVFWLVAGIPVPIEQYREAA